jgi:tetratricopeptide (TPR) repeat protein
MFASSLSRRILRIGGLVVALAAVTPVVLTAQDAPKRELSDKVSEGLGKLREFTEAKQYAEALGLINGLLLNAAPGSYDQVVLNQIKVQILLTEAKYAEAISPLETALRVGKANNFIADKQYLEFTQILSQLYFQEATSTKDTKLRDDYLKKAYNTIQIYLQANDSPTADSIAYAATMIYTQATMDGANPDAKLVKEARDLAEKGLLLTIKPRENFYVLILAALQQDGKNEEAAEILELLITLNPTSKQFWQQLQATYLTLANSADATAEEALMWNVRTIATIERAQKLGILDTPRDHFNVVGILMNIRQFEEAIIMMEKGLANEKIESNQTNFEYLASSYQQVHKPQKAIEVLERATKMNPNEGELDYRISNIYYSLDKIKEAYSTGQTALQKGNLKNKPAVELFVGYLAFELKKYEDALPLVESAIAGGADRADQLYKAIQDAIEARKAALEATI